MATPWEEIDAPHPGLIVTRFRGGRGSSGSRPPRRVGARFDPVDRYRRSREGSETATKRVGEGLDGPTETSAQSGRTPAEMGRCDRTYHVPRSTAWTVGLPTCTRSQLRSVKGSASVGLRAPWVAAAGSLARRGGRWRPPWQHGRQRSTLRATVAWVPWQHGAHEARAEGVDVTAGAAAWAGRSRDSRGAAVLQGFGLAGQSSTGGAHGADRCVRRGTVSHHGRAAAVRQRGIEGLRPLGCSLERLGRELGSQSSARRFGSCRGTSGRRMVEEPARWFGGCSPDRCSPVGGDRVAASVMATSRRHLFPR